MNVGVYIQVPFCQAKCTYCNFYTGVVTRGRYEPYANAVCREINEFDAGSGAAVDTIYLGGGTPSLLEPSTLGRILSATQGKFDCKPTEVTLEADPETITCEKADAWLRAGFNRISLGAQSFQDSELKATGRMHRRGEIYASVQALRTAGFSNISLDLIAGLPHQTQQSWDESIEELLRLHPEHVSIYMLEIDEGSRLGKESLAGGSRYSADAIPSDDAIAEFYEHACERLGAEGYEHYEISNWALEGRSSQHNLKYWRREPYFGFGAGAHSFDGQRRWANVHDSAQYVSCIERGISPRQNVETVTAAQALEEELFLGLRQLGGIDLARIERDYRVNLRERVEGLRREGLVELQGSWLRLSPQRLTVSNEVFLELLG
jgi:oxygen-independent coproporphyrinogen III oxidase